MVIDLNLLATSSMDIGSWPVGEASGSFPLLMLGYSLLSGGSYLVLSFLHEALMSLYISSTSLNMASRTVEFLCAK
jgi:hypothetical protein